MTQPLVFVTRKIAETALKKLEQQVDIEIWPEETPPPYTLLLDKVTQVDGILTLLSDRIDANLIEHAGPKLKVISQMAVGFDNIDAKAATAKGIPVGNTPGVLTETTADFTWALLMAAARRVSEGDREVHAGIWRTWGPDVLTGYDIYGATLGIIGFGRIGQAMARRAKGFSMRVLYHDPHCEPEGAIEAECVGMDELLAQSDFVTLHTYLSPETYHLIGPEQLKKMKPTAILVNTSRGPVVDPEALAWALSEQVIAAAALDVTEPEPIPTDSPLLKLNNLIITPH
ncbi:MAG: D-glycerate dehydrogenase, partial [Anaerolineaceae bacterium]|nr:D-glycerate dehydrogenase [Anaerolineaceae bacterium]